MGQLVQGGCTQPVPATIPGPTGGPENKAGVHQGSPPAGGSRIQAHNPGCLRLRAASNYGASSSGAPVGRCLARSTERGVQVPSAGVTAWSSWSRKATRRRTEWTSRSARLFWLCSTGGVDQVASGAAIGPVVAIYRQRILHFVFTEIDLSAAAAARRSRRERSGNGDEEEGRVSAPHGRGSPLDSSAESAKPGSERGSAITILQASPRMPLAVWPRGPSVRASSRFRIRWPRRAGALVHEPNAENVMRSA